MATNTAVKSMEINELCELLEIKDKENIKSELCNKLSPIIMRFSLEPNWITGSVSGVKGGRSHKDMKYLESKGLMFFHGERPSKHKEIDTPTMLYKVTNLGVQAYNIYQNHIEN